MTFLDWNAVFLLPPPGWCITTYGYGSIPIDTCLVGWTSIYQLFWGSLGTRVLTHPHITTHLRCRILVRCSGLLVTLSVGLRHVRNLGGTMQVAVLSAVELKNIGVKGQQHSTAMFLYLSLKGKTYIYVFQIMVQMFKSWIGRWTSNNNITTSSCQLFRYDLTRPTPWRSASEICFASVSLWYWHCTMYT